MPRLFESLQVPRHKTVHESKHHNLIVRICHIGLPVEFGGLLSFRADAPHNDTVYTYGYNQKFRKGDLRTTSLTQVTRKNSQKKIRLANHLSP